MGNSDGGNCATAPRGDRRHLLSLMYLFVFHGKLVLSVAMSTSGRQSSRLAQERPMLKVTDSYERLSP